jgi:four helix bundle protein
MRCLADAPKTLNVEHSTSNIQHRTFNIEHSAAGRHVSGQLLRSGTSPLAQHGEAQAAESRKDFVHKMKIGLKELRETHRWLRLTQRVPLIEKQELLDPLVDETDEPLVRIFATSIKTAISNMQNTNNGT